MVCNDQEGNAVQVDIFIHTAKMKHIMLHKTDPHRIELIHQ